jgi:hypothetical protein
MKNNNFLNTPIKIRVFSFDYLPEFSSQLRVFYYFLCFLIVRIFVFLGEKEYGSCDSVCDCCGSGDGGGGGIDNWRTIWE